MNSVSWITGSEFFICQNEIDRDINASINIMFGGLRLYMKKIRTTYVSYYWNFSLWIESLKQKTSSYDDGDKFVCLLL